MKKINGIILLLLLIHASSCIFIISEKKENGSLSTMDSLHARALSPDSIVPAASLVPADSIRRDTAVKKFFSGKTIDTKKVPPGKLVEFAKTLIGVPYKYASTDPKTGFDCSGFITYVFNHFGIIVPRSSIDFTEVGKPIQPVQAKPGDLILFTGTDSTEKFVGHMGLIVSNENGLLQFIHSTSGKKYGVTISPLSGYYESRFIKTIRIFPENDK